MHCERTDDNMKRDDRVEEIEKKYEMGVKSGRGGSLLKDLKALQMSHGCKTTQPCKQPMVRTE